MCSCKDNRLKSTGCRFAIAVMFSVVFPANVSDPDVTSYRVTGLSPGSYKFVVKAFNSAGEDSGSTVAIKLEINSTSHTHTHVF